MNRTTISVSEHPVVVACPHRDPEVVCEQADLVTVAADHAVEEDHLDVERSGAGEADSGALTSLAEVANREHVAFEAAMSKAVDHAIRAGDALIEAKRLLAYGRWLPWLNANFAGSVSTASRYMRIARNRSRVTNLHSIRQVLDEIAVPKPRPTVDADWQRKVDRMLARELNDKEVDRWLRQIQADHPQWAADRALIKVEHAIDAVGLLPENDVLAAMPGAKNPTLALRRLADELERSAADLRARA